jgi:hypothetical protein
MVTHTRFAKRRVSSNEQEELWCPCAVKCMTRADTAAQYMFDR